MHACARNVRCIWKKLFIAPHQPGLCKPPRPPIICAQPHTVTQAQRSCGGTCQKCRQIGEEDSSRHFWVNLAVSNMLNSDRQSCCLGRVHYANPTHRRNIPADSGKGTKGFQNKLIRSDGFPPLTVLARNPGDLRTFSISCTWKNVL